MNKTTLTTLPAALALALTLGACGGGSDDPISPPGPSITDCFTVNKTVTFAMTVSNEPLDYPTPKKSVTGPMPNPYDGQTVTGQTIFYLDGFNPAGSQTYTETSYWTMTNSGVKIIAYVDYNSTVTSIDLLFPKDMKPGDKVTDSNNTLYTFIGFKNVTLSGKTFTNTCHIKETDSEGNSDEAWYAPGYGMIQQVDNKSGMTIQYSGDL